MVAVAQTLQEIGTRNAVMPLNKYLDDWGVSGKTKDAIEVAVHSIQERFKGGGHGGLSVVEEVDEQGKLSLAEEQKGRLGLVKKAKTPQRS